MPDKLRDFSFGVVPVRREGSRILFLLVQHRSGHWAFPKGHAEAGETYLQTARRELLEETGVGDVDILGDQKFVEHYDAVKRGREIDKTVTYYLGWVKDSAVRVQPEEIRDFAWLDFDEASQRITFEETREILRAAALAAQKS